MPESYPDVIVPVSGLVSLISRPWFQVKVRTWVYVPPDGARLGHGNEIAEHVAGLLLPFARYRDPLRLRGRHDEGY
jgi:hypothetical protein